MHAVGINFPDLLATQGRYQLRPELPFVPGCEIAGIVREAPAGSGWTAGQRVAAFIWHGGYAETVQVPLHMLAPVPERLSLTMAAAMVVNYHTAHFALARRGRLEPAESVLVLGAAGGIGTAAIQVAKGLGAQVIAGVSSDARAAIARAAGADEIVVLHEGFSSEVRALAAGEGVDVVVDPVGDWLFDEALRALRPEGRILVVGFAAGDIPTVKINRLLLRNVAVVGVAWGGLLDREPGLMRATSSTLNALALEGVVAPQIGRKFVFEQIPDALDALARGEIAGKAVAIVEDRSSA